MILFCHVLIGTNRSSINTCIQPPTMLNNSTNMLPAANMDSDGINRMSKYLRERQKMKKINESTNLRIHKQKTTEKRIYNNLHVQIPRIFFFVNHQMFLFTDGRFVLFSGGQWRGRFGLGLFFFVLLLLLLDRQRNPHQHRHLVQSNAFFDNHKKKKKMSEVPNIYKNYKAMHN